MNESREMEPLSRVVRYNVEALFRGDEPGKRAVTDSRDIVHLVRYMAEGSGVRLVLHSAGGSGRVRAWFDVFGQGAGTLTASDLKYASALSLALTEREVVEAERWTSDIAYAYELKRIRMAPMFTASAEDLAFQPTWLTESKAADQLVFAQPKPSLDAAGELLGAMSRSQHDVWAITALMAPSSLDQRLVLDEIDAVIGRGARAEYAGAIVCARTIVASDAPVSPAVLAGLAKRSVEVEAVPIDVREAHALWADPTQALQGHAVAEGHAVALIRVPAAGNGKGLGISSRLPDPGSRALDPMLPAPATPVRLGTAVDVSGIRVDVTLDAQDLRRHSYVEGKSGSGKSAFLKNVGISWLDTGYPLIALDPHGDVAQALAAHSAARTDRSTHYIRHWDDEHPIGLNVLDATDSDSLAQNIDALLDHMQRVIDPGKEGMFGERAKRTFWIVAEAARHVYGSKLTIQVVQALLLRQGYIRQLANAIEGSDPDAARRLTAELGNLPEKEWNELVSWYQSRFQMWHRTRALRESTGTGVDAIDISEVLDRNANLIVDLASPQLGDPIAGIFGGIYLRKLRDAMGLRKNRNVPVLVIFDEAHLFQDEAPDRLLAEGRKYGLALMLASQSADNLTPRLARAIEANVGSFISLRTGINIASSAATRLGGWSASELTRLPDLTAAASLSSRGVPTDPFTLYIDYYDRAEKDGWTPERLAAAAETVAKATVDDLWLPHADARVPTDAEIVEALKRPAETTKPRRIASAKERERAEGDTLHSMLDNWQDERSRDQPSPATVSEQDERFDVVLDDTGPRLIQIIKVIRQATDLGLIDARIAAQTPGRAIVTAVTLETATKLRAELVAHGAKTHIKRSDVAAPGRWEL